MKAKTRRKLEMGARALIFCRVHPSSSGGIGVTLTLLEQLLRRATELAMKQRDGILLVRTTTARKRDLRGTLRRVYLAHLRQVARMAEPELPGLWRKFVLPRGTVPYRTFRAAASGMAAEAEGRKEVLLKYGLGETTLQSLAKALEEFDRAVEQGTQGHLMHVGAGAELDVVADRVVLMVSAMTGIHRVRFAREPELLAAWESANHVVARPRPAGGDVSPAA